MGCFRAQGRRHLVRGKDLPEGTNTALVLLVVPHSDTQDEKSEGRVGAATALFPSGQSQMVPVHLSLSFLFPGVPVAQMVKNLPAMQET